MPTPPLPDSQKPVVAFGREIPEFGSWRWVGADMAAAVSEEFATCVFRDDIPLCDVVVFVKFKPSDEVLREVSRHSAVIYCPIDCYGSAAEIDADFRGLRCCDRVVIHCERLRKYFSTYCKVEYVDHHLKYHAPLRQIFRDKGPILWVGVRSNLPPFVEWANRQRLPEELWVLTNPEGPTATLQAGDYGFNALNTVRIGVWTPARHREWAELARAAIDIKGNDFRSRHKPPTKALDCLASGIPLAMNQDSSSALHLASLGFDVSNPENVDRWLSREYWNETVRFGRTLCRDLSYEKIAARWRHVLQDVLTERLQKIR